MSGYANPDRPDERLSDAEREEAITRLSEFEVEGRLTQAEFDQRAASARGAVTRGDLAPLFTDLPSAGPARESAPWEPGRAASAATGTPGAVSAPAPPAYPADAGPARTSRALGGRVGDTVMALSPFVALLLFFAFGFWAPGGFTWSWLFFFLIPITGIIVYGGGSAKERSR
ncbi:DUF1707 SHOCT-like domain-containing protein [Agromyces arachidis]|uniref:DUF1707 SHOCT-like domain-containing protein n=1 Tax=Agromyces arachidis TaxID=766966 RepID=UPI0040567F4B